MDRTGLVLMCLGVACVALVVAARALALANDLARVWRSEHEDVRRVRDLVMGHLDHHAESLAADARIVKWMGVLNRRVDALERGFEASGPRGFNLPEDLDLGPWDSGAN